MIAALDQVTYTYSVNVEVRSIFREGQTYDTSEELLIFRLHAE
jgi:hypothetical protein